MKSRIKLTYEDYRHLPESETQRYELLEGELVMVLSPSAYHQQVKRNVVRALWDFVRNNKLGEVLDAPCDVVLGEHTVLQPDILYVSAQRLSILAREGIRGAPDLVIEILSPGTADRDRTTKRSLYAQHGVKECWIVDPDSRTIEVLELGELGFRSVAVYTQEQTLRSALLAGLAIPLTEVF